jgi:predicted RNA-binding Zn ribbon-like protein
MDSVVIAMEGITPITRPDWETGLAYVNTVDWRLDPLRRRDFLGDFRALLDFCLRQGLLSQESAAILAASAKREPEVGKAAFSEGVSLREDVYGLLVAVAHGSAPDASAIGRLWSLMLEALASENLVWTGKGFALEIHLETETLRAPLYAIARRSLDLLLSPSLERLRICAAPDCGWLFIDTSKNGKRRWCEMRTCGNRAKARRHREKQVGDAPSSALPCP